ncbi:hypothetical protein DI005_26545 [Prauserella sp. PE36]|uniref:Uncharacterized protein n=1 Tax=Prauserella endophytica TaxID=1592324 RepID=A0ABY2S2L8_9PSEU|nr:MULTISPECIES: hypothetical protein [Prauserella]PXY33050.1 hypothetical protein BAY59_07985 [Prauserella coralliicola]RBM16395.1 hypothetical protein DI005_26545 [Prauserella sp. PE36]TKG69536.1 hypothetical protein FCN18_18695 [Prauserella endophytica]
MARMPGDWAWDAVRAEVAYRQDELRKAGRGAAAARRRRWGRAVPEPRIPEQRAGEYDAGGPEVLRRAS